MHRPFAYAFVRALREFARGRPNVPPANVVIHIHPRTAHALVKTAEFRSYRQDFCVRGQTDYAELIPGFPAVFRGHRVILDEGIPEGSLFVTDDLDGKTEDNVYLPTCV